MSGIWPRGQMACTHVTRGKLPPMLRNARSPSESAASSMAVQDGWLAEPEDGFCDFVAHVAAFRTVASSAFGFTRASEAAQLSTSDVTVGRVGSGFHSKVVRRGEDRAGLGQLAYSGVASARDDACPIHIIHDGA